MKTTLRIARHAGACCLVGFILAATSITSGQVPDTLHATVEVQTREILAKIDRLLREAGTDKSKLITANVWLADIMTFEEMNRPWEAWLAPGAAPARATVEARIANPGYRVEIACSAAL